MTNHLIKKIIKSYYIKKDIIKFFKIDAILFTTDKNSINKSDIFILKYSKCNELSFSFSFGKILSLDDNQILPSASTDNGSSGVKIIRRCKENILSDYIIVEF